MGEHPPRAGAGSEVDHVVVVRSSPSANTLERRPQVHGKAGYRGLPGEGPSILPISRAGPRTVYSSPLRRARSSAALLFPGERVSVDQRLSERAVGDWEGLDHATVEARWPDAFANGVVDPFVTPPDGETGDHFKERVASFLEMLLSSQYESAGSEAYVVTHNGWIRVALLLNGQIGLGELFAEPVPFLRPIPLALDPQAVRTAMRR